MPTATSFTALGRGSGFPLCLEKVDVSGYDRWTTLGGVSKESPSPTDAKISTSLVNAMKLYWNLYSLKGTCSVSGSNNVETISASVDEVVANFNTVDGLKPNERVCVSGVPGTEDFETDEDLGSLGNLHIAKAQLSIGIEFEFMRFYDGETTDENNFIGYGLESFNGDPFVPGGGESAAFMNFTASARYTDTEDSIGNNAGAYDCIGSVVEEEDTDWTYSYVTISGIPFVRATFNYFQGSSPEPTREATIDSIDFYTYN